MAIRAVLFDMDGTLVQTREASWELFRETNERFTLGIDTRERFFELFEQNFFRSLAESCSDRDRLALAKEHFLTNLRTRYAPPLVPGMADVVRALADRFTLAVLSTNTIATIRRILTNAGLAHCFAHVFAGDVEPDKSASMRRFLADAGYRMGRRCSPAYDEAGISAFVAGDEIILITDTVGDIAEANAAGVRTFGVTWGMHAERELLAAGAERVALWPQELCAWLLPESDASSEATRHATCGPSACTCTPSLASARRFAVAPESASRHAAAADAPATSDAMQRVRDAARIRHGRAPQAAPVAAHPVQTSSHDPPPRIVAAASAAPLDTHLLATLRRLHRAPVRYAAQPTKGLRP
jgi:phosphoglycolate phosphatase